MRKTIETEVCAYSLESCEAARSGGATRVELCAGPAEGGTTPSMAAIDMARRIPGLQLSVMIRPRGGDFLYSPTEFDLMKRDIEYAAGLNADGVVIGILTSDGTVDVKRTAELVRLAGPLQVTFHRAFDMVRDQSDALEAVIDSGCSRILTSGGRNTAMEGIDTIRRLVDLNAGRIALMAGSGVNPANALPLAETGIDALHFSARSVRGSSMIFRNPNVSMGGVPNMGEYDIACANPDTIRSIFSLVSQLS